MPIKNVGITPKTPSLDEKVTHSYMPNSDIAPLDRVDLHKSIQESDQKLLKELQKKEADKKYYKDTLVSFDEKSEPKIDATPLKNVKKTIDYFESLNKPTLALPKNSLPLSAGTPTANAPKEKNTLDNFYDWFIKPIKDFFYYTEENKDAAVPMLSESAKNKLSDYYQELEEELEQIKEVYKENNDEIQTKAQREQSQRLRWINCIKAQLKSQDEQMERIIDVVSFKQEAIQHRQKHRTKVAIDMDGKERATKPLDWINKGASVAQLTAASLSAALLVASFCIPGVGVATGIQSAIGAIGGIASIAEGGSRWLKADARHELDQMVGQLTKWRQEDDLETKEIEEAMKELTSCLESVQSHWEELSHIAKMQNNLTKSMINNY